MKRSLMPKLILTNIMGAMIQRDKMTQRLYLHDVVVKKEASAYQPEHLNTTGPLESKNHFTTEVLEKALSVGYSLLQKENKVKKEGSRDFIPSDDTLTDTETSTEADEDEEKSRKRGISDFTKSIFESP